MIERNRLTNGRFYHNLSGWTVSGAVYNAGDGDDHFGVAVLATGGDYLEQTLAVPRSRLYTAHVAAKCTSTLSGSEVTLRIQDGNGNTVTTQNIAITADTWTENEFSVGMLPGTTYTVRITNASAGEDVKIDDVWIWFVPYTRAEIATRTEAKIKVLADDLEYSTASNGAKTEGDYTYSVDAGLRNAGAINPETGLPDVRYLDADQVQIALDIVEREMLEQMQRAYIAETDIRVGEVDEKRSQVAAALAALTGGGKNGAGTGRIAVRKLTRS